MSVVRMIRPKDFRWSPPSPLRGEGGLGGRGGVALSYCARNRLAHTLDVFHHLTIREAEHAEPVRLQENIALRIFRTRICGHEVGIAVQLNRE